MNNLKEKNRKARKKKLRKRVKNQDFSQRWVILSQTYSLMINPNLMMMTKKKKRKNNSLKKKNHNLKKMLNLQLLQPIEKSCKEKKSGEELFDKFSQIGE